MAHKKSSKKSSRAKVASSAIDALFESLEEAKRIAASFGKSKKRKPKTSALFESIEEAKKIARLFVSGGKSAKKEKASSRNSKAGSKQGKPSSVSSNRRKTSKKFQPVLSKRPTKKTQSQSVSRKSSSKGVSSKGQTSKTSTKKSILRAPKSIEQIIDTSNYKTYNQWARSIIKNADRIDRELPKGHRFVAKYMDGTTMSTTEKVSKLIERLNTYDASKDFGNDDRNEVEPAEDLLESIRIYEVPDRWAHMREIREERAAHKVRSTRIQKGLGKSLGTKTSTGRRKSQTDLMEDALKRIQELEAKLGGKKRVTKRKTK